MMHYKKNPITLTRDLKGTVDEIKDTFMDHINLVRRHEVYEHSEDDCSSRCREKGEIVLFMRGKFKILLPFTTQASNQNLSWAVEGPWKGRGRLVSGGSQHSYIRISLHDH